MRGKEVINQEVLQGGYKADNNKPRVALIPPNFVLELAALFTLGAGKYSAYNWSLGMCYSRVYDAMMRHSLKFWGGEEFDEVDGQHHLLSVAWCACVLWVFSFADKARYEKWDDRPHKYTDERIRAEINTSAKK